jgi:hypothetical protein
LSKLRPTETVGEDQVWKHRFMHKDIPKAVRVSVNQVISAGLKRNNPPIGGDRWVQRPPNPCMPSLDIETRFIHPSLAVMNKDIGKIERIITH